MGILESLGSRIDKSFGRGRGTPVPAALSLESLASMAGEGGYGMQIEALRGVSERVGKGEGSDIDRLLSETMARAGAQNGGQYGGAVWKGKGVDRRLESAVGENISGYIGINDYGFQGMRQ